MYANTLLWSLTCKHAYFSVVAYFSNNKLLELFFCNYNLHLQRINQIGGTHRKIFITVNWSVISTSMLGCWSEELGEIHGVWNVSLFVQNKQLQHLKIAFFLNHASCCVVITCGNRIRRAKTSFCCCLPVIPSKGSERKEQLIKERRSKWLCTLKRSELNHYKTKNIWIFQDHFLRGVVFIWFNLM